MANEYGRWFVRNDPQTSRRNMGAYKRPFGERYKRPAEYTPTVDEYRHYPAMKDIAAEQEEKKKQLEQNDKPQQKNASKQQTKMRGRQATQNIIKNIAGKAVAIVGGGAVVVAGYQAINAEMALRVEPAPIVQYVEADWEAWDASEFTIMVTLRDPEGNVIKEVPAVITLTEIAPTCTQEGSMTYTATAEDGGNTYTDSHTEPVAMIEHTLDGGKVGTNENGDPVIVYECSECHEKFEVAVISEEND